MQCHLDGYGTKERMAVSYLGPSVVEVDNGKYVDEYGVQYPAAIPFF